MTANVGLLLFLENRLLPAMSLLLARIGSIDSPKANNISNPKRKEILFILFCLKSVQNSYSKVVGKG